MKVPCIVFMWQGFGSSRAAGVASVRRHQVLPSCQTETVPDASKMEPPLPKAEPFSDAGGASVITYLRKGKNCCAALVRGK